MKSLVKIFGASALLCGVILAPARAQLGSGSWTSYSPGYSTQVEGCGYNSGLYFELTCSTTHSQNSNYQRAERRYNDIPTSYHASQFQGNVVVNSLSGTDICLKQTFQDPTGPWNMIAVSNGGYLYEVEGGAYLAAYTIGTSAQINTILWDSNHVEVYVNGSWVEAVENGVSPMYDKIGTYRTDSGYGPIQAHWSGVQFWYQ